MTTDPVRRQNGIIAFILPNGADIIQAVQGIHATVGQPPGVAQYIDEQLGSNQPERKRWVRELDKNVKVEAKTLGVFNKVGNGFCAVHLLFCLLEFCITIPTAHFGCQATCCNKEMDMDLVPIVIVGDVLAPAENNPAPPAYSDIVLSPSVEGY